MTTTETWDLGLTYWPPRVGYRWWEAFDRGELRENLRQIAALGIRHVRICLTWETVQSAPRKLDSNVLRSFERVLDAAGELGMKLTVSLFPLAIGGSLFVPRWLANPDPLDDLLRLGRLDGPISQVDLPAVVYEGAYRANRSRDFFRDPAAIGAQQYLLHEVVGYFGSHPAVQQWQLGEGLESAHPPTSDTAVAEWFATMVEAARNAYPAARLLGVTSAAGLLQQAGPRPEQIAAACDAVGVALDAPLPLSQFRSDSPDAIEFIYALAAGLAGKPVFALGLGLPTAPDNRPTSIGDAMYGRSITTVLASGQQQSEFLATTLSRLRNLGAPLVVLADFADYPHEAWRYAPLDRSFRSRTLGIIDRSGREKPAVEAIREQASAKRTIAANPLATTLDPERYWHDPARECQRLWLGFMRER